MGGISFVTLPHGRKIHFQNGCLCALLVSYSLEFSATDLGKGFNLDFMRFCNLGIYAFSQTNFYLHILYLLSCYSRLFISYFPYGGSSSIYFFITDKLILFFFHFDHVPSLVAPI